MDKNKTETEKKIMLSNEVYFREVRALLDEGKSVTVPVKGTSMLPFIVPGRDRVVLKKTDTVMAGDIVLALIDGRNYVLHRVYGIDGEAVVLMGDGNLYARERCTVKDIFGTVVIIERKGRKIDVSSRSHCITATLWKKLLPARKYLLALFRMWNRFLRIF